MEGFYYYCKYNNGTDTDDTDVVVVVEGKWVHIIDMTTTTRLNYINYLSQLLVFQLAGRIHILPS